MPRVSAVVSAYNRAKPSDIKSLADSHEIDLSVNEVVEVIKASATHTISVSAPIFGLVEVTKNQAINRLTDNYFVSQCERMADRHESPIVVSVTITPAYVRRRMRQDRNGYRVPSDEDKRPTKYRVAVHWIGVRKGGSVYYFT